MFNHNNFSQQYMNQLITQQYTIIYDKRYIMLTRIRKLLIQIPKTQQFLPKLIYPCSSNKLGRQLTSKIMQIHTKNDLMKLLSKHKTSFNIMNITALLKKMTINESLKDQKLYARIFDQIIIKQWNTTCIQPNPDNSRAIANIIGYTASLSYLGMNTYFQKLNYPKLLSHTKPKQFIMIFRGLLKLNIYHQCITPCMTTQNLIFNHVNHYYTIGQLISVWRNLIKYNEITLQISEYLIELIALKKVNNNLKDYGYLVYCYISYHQKYVNVNENVIANVIANDGDVNDAQSRDMVKIKKMLEQYPENILYSTRVTIYEICILLDYLTKLKAIKQKKSGTTTNTVKLQTSIGSNNFNYLLEQHYLRNIKAKTQLRSLANGYHSMINYFGMVSTQVYNLTGKKFIDALSVPSSAEHIQDYQSISSLFVQIQNTSPYSNPQSQQQQTQIEYNRLFTIQQLLEAVTNFVFTQNDTSSKKPHLLSMSNKQFQKLLYGYYIFSRMLKKLTLSSQHKSTIISSILSRSNLTDIQINSLVMICAHLEIKDQILCRYFKGNIKNQKNKNSNAKDEKLNKCIMGVDYKCLNCFQ